MDVKEMLKDTLYEREFASTHREKMVAEDKINNLLKFAGYWLSGKEQDEIIAIYDDAMAHSWHKA